MAGVGGSTGIVWYANSGNGVFGGAQLIASNGYDGFSYVADVDGDGDQDVVGTKWTNLAWFANDGTGAFGPEQIISTIADNTECVFSTDLNGDGDPDLLAAISSENKVVWYENLGGGVFGVQLNIAFQIGEASAVSAADLDGDGDMDVITASPQGYNLLWHENNGVGDFAIAHVIDTRIHGLAVIVPVDVDADGRTDVLSGSSFDDKVAWSRNTGNTIGLEERVRIPGASLFPVPMRAEATVLWPGVDGLVRVDILDLEGRVVQAATSLLSTQGIVLERGTWPPGAYLLRLSNGRRTTTVPFIAE